MRKQPQPFFPFIGDPGAFAVFHLGVSEERPKEQDFQEHPAHYAGGGGGVVQFTVFDPGQGFLLAGRGRDPERNRGLGPGGDPPDHPDQKYQHRRIGKDDPEQELQIGRQYSYQGDHDQEVNNHQCYD